MKKQDEKLNEEFENEVSDESAGFSGVVRVISLVIILAGMIIWSPMIALIIEARFDAVQPNRYEHIMLSVLIFLLELVLLLVIVFLPAHIRKKMRQRRHHK